MKVLQVQSGLFQLRLPGVNAFLLDSESDGLVLIDTGSAANASGIRAAVRTLGRDVGEIQHILVTHCHPDHAGGLATLKALTSARVYMHRRDAMLVETGRAMRPMSPPPGILNAILFRVMIAPKPTTVSPVTADERVGNGDLIPVAGGITVIHTPGHSEGHLVFLSKDRGVVFLGDAAANLLGLRLMMAYEHLQQGVMSLQNLCRFDFDTACFGHGSPILKGADGLFRDRWGPKRAPRKPTG